MSSIKTAIALSDLHLGMDISYLHTKSPGYQKSKNALLALLQRLGPQDELILNGDFIDLAVAGLDEVYRDAKEFFKLLAEAGPFERIVYIPGNHDHHFWRALGENVYIDGKLNQGMEPPGHFKYPNCFVDERFSSHDPNLACDITLSYLWPKNKPMPEMVVKYPHHLARLTLNDGSEKPYLFTHGHFFENRFKPVNYLIDPAHLEELEAFNNFWLESFNYYWGHAGKFSDKVREIEGGYRRDETEARQKVNEIMNEICCNLISKMKLRWPMTWLLKCALKLIVNKISLEDKSELRGSPIDENLRSAITAYLEKYVIQRYRKGKGSDYFFPGDSDIPTPFTFVFGHTHRPISGKQLEEAGVIINGIKYPLANTDGWLRTDCKEVEGQYAGALVINENGIRWETLAGKLE